MFIEIVNHYAASWRRRGLKTLARACILRGILWLFWRNRQLFQVFFRAGNKLRIFGKKISLAIMRSPRPLGERFLWEDPQNKISAQLFSRKLGAPKCRSKLMKVGVRVAYKPLVKGYSLSRRHGCYWRL
jgi:hypothetical protein